MELIRMVASTPMSFNIAYAIKAKLRIRYRVVIAYHFTAELGKTGDIARAAACRDETSAPCTKASRAEEDLAFRSKCTNA